MPLALRGLPVPSVSAPRSTRRGPPRGAPRRHPKPPGAGRCRHSALPPHVQLTLSEPAADLQRARRTAPRPPIRAARAATDAPPRPPGRLRPGGRARPAPADGAPVRQANLAAATAGPHPANASWCVRRTPRPEPPWPAVLPSRQADGDRVSHRLCKRSAGAATERSFGRSPGGWVSVRDPAPQSGGSSRVCHPECRPRPAIGAGTRLLPDLAG
jgi:hypothetical protein